MRERLFIGAVALGLAIASIGSASCKRQEAQPSPSPITGPAGTVKPIDPGQILGERGKDFSTKPARPAEPQKPARAAESAAEAGWTRFKIP